MLRINLHTEDFNRVKATYSKCNLIKTYKNGSEDYQVLCTCPDCGGHGYLTWTSVDQGRCWKCNATGKVSAIVHVGNDCKKQLTREEVEANIKAYREKNRNHWLSLGFKKVDFELKEWAWKLCSVWFNDSDYYRIVKESEKAYLMEQVCDINSSQSYSSYWVPKKAVVFKEID